MKNKMMFLFMFLFMLLIVNVVSVSAESTTGNQENASIMLRDTMKLNKFEIARLQGLGFSNEEIDDMTLETYNLQKGLYGSKVGSLDTYFKVTKNGKIKISKEQAEKEIKEHNEKIKKKSTNGEFSTLNVDYTDTEYTSWLKMTSTVTKYMDQYYRYTGKYRFKNNWNWLTNPQFKFTDATAVTYSSHFTYSQNSEYSLYSIDRRWASGNYKDTSSISDYTADSKSVNAGIGFKVNLLSSYGGYEAYNHRGMMYIDATLANANYTSGNMFGHYAHTEAQYSALGINMTNGTMTLSGALKTTYANDTGVSFTTK